MHVYETVADVVYVFTVDALCWQLSWMHVYERVAMGSPLHRRAIDYAWKRFLWFLPVKAWARMEFGRLR